MLNKKTLTTAIALVVDDDDVLPENIATGKICLELDTNSNTIISPNLSYENKATVILDVDSIQNDVAVLYVVQHQEGLMNGFCRFEYAHNFYVLSSPYEDKATAFVKSISNSILPEIPQELIHLETADYVEINTFLLDAFKQYSVLASFIINSFFLDVFQPCNFLLGEEDVGLAMIETDFQSEKAPCILAPIYEGNVFVHPSLIDDCAFNKFSGFYLIPVDTANEKLKVIRLI